MLERLQTKFDQDVEDFLLKAHDHTQLGKPYLIGQLATEMNENDPNKLTERLIILGFELEKQIADAKTNINRIDWQNKPIYAFAAKATVIVRPLEPVKDLENLPKNPPTWVLDSRLRLPKVGNEQQIWLTLADARRFFDDSWAGRGAMVGLWRQWFGF